MPDQTVKMSKRFITKLGDLSFNAIAYEVSRRFIDDIPAAKLKKIITETFNYPIVLKKLEKNLYILELFHGPTAAFKDFGARFMARIFSFYLAKANQQINIVTATSGDTGSAVASGFFGVSNAHVFILYPSAKVSPLQEKQLTTFGGNITAIEVKGTFDDCQRLAKAVLRKGFKGARLSSANSINFGRLLPQSFYYFWGVGELQKKYSLYEPPVFVVPSGNFGNLMGGIIAQKMGLPVSGFVAATNVNKVVPEYLRTGKFVPRKSKQTISNAMDVGNPSNFARMQEAFDGAHRKMQKFITGISVSDNDTRQTIKSIYKRSGYILDPHTAVGVAAAKRMRSKMPTIILGTAHPAKFLEIVTPAIGKKVSIPKRLIAVLRKKKKSIIIKNDPKDLKKVIWNYLHVANRRN